MKVRAKFSSDLKDTYAAGSLDGSTEVVLREGATVGDVLESLRVDEREVGFIVVNGEKVQKQDPLSEGQVIQVFALETGG